MEKIIEQHTQELATGEGMPEAPEVDLGPSIITRAASIITRADIVNAVKELEAAPKKFTPDAEGNILVTVDSEAAARLDELAREIEETEIELSECGCGSCIEEGNDDFKMLHDMIVQLASRVTELENRIAAHNVKASHKI